MTKRRADTLNSQSEELSHYKHSLPSSTPSLYFDGHQNGNSRNNNHYSTSSSLQNLHYTPHNNRHHSTNERNPLPTTINSGHLSQSQSYSAELDAVLRVQENHDHTAQKRLLHTDGDIISSPDYNFQEFHQPNSRKIPKASKDIPLIDRPTADTLKSTIRSANRDFSSLPNNDMQRLKNTRRLESVHVTSAKTNLTGVESWQTDPTKMFKSHQHPKSSNKHVQDELKKLKEDAQILSKPTQKMFEELLIKNDIKKPVCKVPPYERSAKDQIQEYIQQKRQQKQEESLLNDKRHKDEQEKQKRDKLKKFHEQIQAVHQQQQLLLSNKTLDEKQKKISIPGQHTTIPIAPIISFNDVSEQARQQKLVRLLGPKPETTNVTMTESQLSHSISTSSVSSSSSSPSTFSVIESNNRPKNHDLMYRASSQPPSQIRSPQIQTENRQDGLLKWAINLKNDCDNVQENLRTFKLDGTHKSEIISTQFDSNDNNLNQEGNLRHHVASNTHYVSAVQPIYLMNQNQNNSEQQYRSSEFLRSTERLSRQNRNWTSEFNINVPDMGDLKDPLLIKRIQREQAAGKIQAAYRGYTVRKSLQWSIENDNYDNRQSKNKDKRLFQQYHHPLKNDPGLVEGIDFKFNDDHCTTGSTMLASQTYQLQQSLRTHQQKKSHLSSIYSDDHGNYSSILSSPVHIQQRKHITDTHQSNQHPSLNLGTYIDTFSHEKQQNISYVCIVGFFLGENRLQANTSSSPTHTVQNDQDDEKTARESYIFKNSNEKQRRRSFSPPLPPQMSPDSGRPINSMTTLPPPQSHHRLSALHYDFEDKRFSPDALERQLTRGFNPFEGIEQSTTQIDNVDKIRSLALAQQEALSMTHILKNMRQRDPLDNEQVHSKQLQSKKMSFRHRLQQQKSASPSPSSSPSHSRRQFDRYSPPLQQQQCRRTINQSPPTSSSESILTAREKKFRQKFNSEQEVEAWGKRLKDVEKKLRTLEKRAVELFDDKRSVSSPPNSRLKITEQQHQRSKSTPLVLKQTKDDSTISSEDILSKESILNDSQSSVNQSIVQKSFGITVNNNDQSKIKIDTNLFRHKSNDYDENFDTSIPVTTTSVVVSQRKIDIHPPITITTKQVSESDGESFSVVQSDMTSDMSDVEYRIKQLREQLKRKKFELDTLKKDQRRKNKEVLRKQEDELKKQIQSCDTEIQTLRHQIDSVPPVYSILSTPTTETDKSLSSNIHSSVNFKIKPIDLKTLTNNKSFSSTSSTVSSSTPISLSKNQERHHQQIQTRIIENEDERKMRILTPEQSIVEEIEQSKKSHQEKSLSKNDENVIILTFQEKIVSSHKNKYDNHIIDDKDFFDNIIDDDIDNDVISDKQKENVSEISEKKVEEQKLIELFSPTYDRTNHDVQSIVTVEILNDSPVNTDDEKRNEKSIEFNVLKQNETSPSSSSSSTSFSSPKPEGDIKSDHEKSVVLSPEKEKSVNQVKPTTFSRIQKIHSVDLSTGDCTSIDYDEDFSEMSHSIMGTSKTRQKSLSPSSPLLLLSKITNEQLMKEDEEDNIGIELIPEDLQFSKSQQLSIKTFISSDEQSEILVLVKNSHSTTSSIDQNASLTDHLVPQQYELVSEDKLLKSDEKQVITEEDEHNRSLLDKNDDIRYGAIEKSDKEKQTKKVEEQQLDIAYEENLNEFFSNRQTTTTTTTTTSLLIEDEQKQNQKQETDIPNEQNIDHISDHFIRTFINEAIKESKIIKQRKELKNISLHLTKEASEWISDESMSDEDKHDQSNDTIEQRKIKNEDEEDIDEYVHRPSNQPDFIKQINVNDVEQDGLKLDLSRLEEKSADEPRIESPRKLIIEEQIKPVVPHTFENVNEICQRATTILFQQNKDFSDRTRINRTIPNDYFQISKEADDTEKRSQHAYQVMIYDLCTEILYEIYTPNVRQSQYPWQKAQFVSKRYYYRFNPPTNKTEAQKFVNEKILELLGLVPCKIQYSKWRNPKRRDEFENVLFDELRRQEPNWINYDDECIQIKFDIADMIFDQILSETLNECIDVIKRRSSINGAISP
ncbi:unnamed protein product [Didymodactylos carnosus]|uniref:DUF4378 domain-containing protein n=1 Tax=Didymodactylos carnosus TaxID=1234261 RepID=A0A8S2CR54_9BILA|nr:unnamed protein product [Didymodactylos carnosus]CAF3498099.1 unnamed protein product [Didymodactylos carnosus]